MINGADVTIKVNIQLWHYMNTGSDLDIQNQKTYSIIVFSSVGTNIHPTSVSLFHLSW